MNVSFSAHTSCNCDGCGLRATHGFFVQHDNDSDSEIFLCTGCAQKDLAGEDLHAAVDAHRQICFERAEEERKNEEIILAWLDYEEEGMGVAC